jgi:mono/diheme cytochrome c family protein
MRWGLNTGLIVWAAGCGAAQATITPEQAAQLPAPANHAVSFSKEIKPIFEASCINCHGRGKDKGGFRLDTRATMLKGGDSGPTVLPGKSAESLLIALVRGLDPDNIMPRKGSRLTPAQIGVLRAWIDQGAPWDANVTFGRVEPANLKPRLPAIPSTTKTPNPVDRFLEVYFAAHQFKPPRRVSDRLFARRAYLDVIGLLPPPEELGAFVADRHEDKRDRLVERLLADNRNYTEHWLSFWNDLLRNDYKGTGYIDGGRKQITHWLYSALLTNMPYNEFVAELVNATPDSEGFTKGIVWRGVVNASQTPQMQAAQNIAQVFMGVNLKCASCHDSFINDLTLADAYGLAGIYADGPLEMVRCDMPTGKKAELKFLYPELGAIDPKADKPARLKRLAEIITQRQDARLTRTLVNRLWERFMGRGLIQSVDDMEKTAWDPDLLDWLAEDLAAHNCDVKHLIRQILSSRAYQLPAVNLGEQPPPDFVFRGPAVRRLSAEQFRDALTRLTGIGYSSPAAEMTLSESEQERSAPSIQGKVRAALVAADPLLVALGRPNREQVLTSRASAATTLQALELTNGETLADLLRRGAGNLLTAPAPAPGDLISVVYEKALGRKPTAPELQGALELIGQPAQSAGVEDLLWAVAMLPEFQLIY